VDAEARITRKSHDKERIERRIPVTDKAIDALVYELYGLTEDEIRILETAPTREVSAGGR
jgi:hypothetical protein